MRFGLVGRFTLTIVLLLTIGLGLVVYLNFAKFRQTLIRLEASQFLAIGAEIVSTIENGLNLGLALNQIETLDRVLAEAQSLNGNIKAIQIVTLGGELLTSTNRAGGYGRAIVGPEIELKKTDEYWHREGQFDFQLGLPIINSFGKTTGELILVYAKNNFEMATNTVWADLRSSVFTAWIVMAAVTGPIVLLAVCGFTRHLRRLGDALDNAANEPIVPFDGPQDVDGLELALGRFLEAERASVVRTSR